MTQSKRDRRAARFLPESIYGHLPHVYIACGVLVLLVVGQNPYAVSSAGLFILAGIIVLAMRRLHCGHRPRPEIPARLHQAKHIHLC